jgi:hypothetical protein
MSKGFYLEQGYKLSPITNEIDFNSNPDFYGRHHTAYAKLFGPGKNYYSGQSKYRKHNQSAENERRYKRCANKHTRQYLKNDLLNELEDNLGL